MTTGAAYVLCETFGWKHGLHAKPAEARKFYCAIAACTTGAMAIALLGLNPIKALYWAAIVQGMLAPPLMVLIMLITNNRAIMGRWVNGRLLNALGWITTAAASAAALGLLVSLLH
jgi:Mn2+/Fe2+ NRAMP family transporter